MKLMNQMKRYNLQFFASNGSNDDADDSGDDGDDNQDDEEDEEESDKSKKSDKKSKTFTQEELDAAIERRLKRERDKAKKAKKAKEKAEADSKKTPDDKKAEADKAQSEKVSALEAKLLCFEHDVAKDSVSDVVALARAYVDEDTDFEEAIEKVIKKYPQFVKDSGKKAKRDKDADAEDEDDEEEEETDNRSWGKRQSGKSKKVDGVEAAFLKKNPGLKID